MFKGTEITIQHIPEKKERAVGDRPLLGNGTGEPLMEFSGGMSTLRGLRNVRKN